MKKLLLIVVTIFTLLFITIPVLPSEILPDQVQQEGGNDLNAEGIKNQAVIEKLPMIIGKALFPAPFAAGALENSTTWGNLSDALLTGRFPALRKHIVVIDAGHGGSESGAVHGGINEKDLNLDIAKRLETLLKAQDINTYMTRTDDRYVGLYDRSDLANNLDATLFISIHNNAGNSWEQGSMTLYYPSEGDSGYGITGYEFAGIVQKHLNDKLDTNFKGIIPRPNLAVLRTTKMPAVLAEIGYMTNQQELDRLKTAEFRQNAAEALRDSILEALKSCK
jgi:N-acetylmuramoyl-L-alanine amidase